LLLLLRPIVRFALARSLRIRDVVEYLKIVFVQIANEELEKLGEPQTASKVSAMTGIQRREIGRLLGLGPELRSDVDVIARVIGRWQNSPEYTTSRGQPKVLELKSREGRFAELVAEVSTDLNPYTVAFELERSGTVEQTPKGLRLLRSAYEPKANFEDGLQLLAADAENLFAGVTENIFQPKALRNMHIKTEYDSIPASKEREIRQWLLNKGAAFHKELRDVLSQFDTDLNPELALAPQEGIVKVSVTSFSLTTTSSAEESV
jgi:hypothetical protein